jgi:predicted Zn-dependent peptidase
VPVPRIIAYGSGTPQVELVFAGLPSSDARVPAAAMAAWFLGGFAGPLMRRLRGDRGWVYNLRSELVVLRQRALPLIVVFSTRDAPGCAAEVLRVLTALHTDAAWDAAARAGFAGLRERFAREEASKFLRPRDLANRAVELAWQGYTVRGWMAAIEAVGPDELRDALREGWRLNAAGAVARGCRSPRAAVAKLRRVLGGSPRKRSASG